MHLRFLALIAIIVLQPTFSNGTEIGEFSYYREYLNARYEDEGGGRKAIHARYCAFDVMAGNSALGVNCVRAKVYKEPGKAQSQHLIFDSDKISAFKLETKEYDKKNSKYKFWLRDRSQDDTQNFNSFIKKLPEKDAALLGFLCKRISDEKWFPSALRDSWNVANSENIFSLKTANNRFSRIAKRCYETVEKRVGTLTIKRAVPKKSAPENKSVSKLCGYQLVRIEAPDFDRKVELQSALKKLGLYKGKLDGDFGPNSCNALKKYVKSKTPGNVPVPTKYLPQEMLSSLLGKPQVKDNVDQLASKPPAPEIAVSNANQLCGYELKDILKFGSDQKIQMQQALSTLDYHEGRVDGNFDEKSCNALNEFISRKTPTYLMASKKFFTQRELNLLLNQAGEKAQKEVATILGNTSPLDEKTEKLSAENASLVSKNKQLIRELTEKENLFANLDSELATLKADLLSNQDETSKLTSLVSEQKKLTSALKDKISSLESESLKLNTDLVTAEQKLLSQANNVAELKAKNSDLSSDIASLIQQTSDLKADISAAEQLVQNLQLEKDALQVLQGKLEASNKRLEIANNDLDKKLNKLTSKNLLEGGLSGISEGSKSSESSIGLNSGGLGGGIISKTIVSNLRSEVAALKIEKEANLQAFSDIEKELLSVRDKLSASENVIVTLKSEKENQTQELSNLASNLESTAAKVEKREREITRLLAEISELRSFKEGVIEEKAREIEAAKAAIIALFENKKALVIQSKNTQGATLEYVNGLIDELQLSPDADTFDVFLSENNTYDITLGVGTPEECNSMRDQLISFGSIPKESFCGDWNGYVASYDALNGKLVFTMGNEHFSQKFETSENVNHGQDDQDNNPPRSIQNSSTESANSVIEDVTLKEAAKSGQIENIFDSENKQRIAEYYFKLPKIGSDEFICAREPGASNIRNKKIFACDKKGREEYHLHKYEETKNLSAKQLVGYNDDRTVNFAYAYLESSFPAYNNSWFETKEQAETFVEQIYGQADKREVGNHSGFGLTYAKTDYEYVLLSYGCDTFFFNKPSSKLDGFVPGEYRNFLEEISAEPLQELVDDKHLSHLSREIVMPDVVGRDRCAIVTIASWTQASNRMGQEGTEKVSIYVAEAQTSFTGIGDWDQWAPVKTEYITNVTGYLANPQLGSCWGAYQHVNKASNEELYMQLKEETEPVLSAFFNVAYPDRIAGTLESQWEFSVNLGTVEIAALANSGKVAEGRARINECLPIITGAAQQAQQLIKNGQIPEGGFNFPGK